MWGEQNSCKSRLHKERIAEEQTTGGEEQLQERTAGGMENKGTMAQMREDNPNFVSFFLILLGPNIYQPKELNYWRSGKRQN